MATEVEMSTEVIEDDDTPLDTLVQGIDKNISYNSCDKFFKFSSNFKECSFSYFRSSQRKKITKKV